MPEHESTPADLAGELVAQIDFLGEVADLRQDLAKLGKVCEQLSTSYRALGICLLSEAADVDGFFHHLIQSALTRWHYLRGAGSRGERAHRRASFIDPVFDAIAARQWRLAADTLNLTASDWLEGEEYEDDFSQSEFVRRWLAGASLDALDPILARWKRALEKGRDPRLGVARALARQDWPAFADCLRALLAANERAARAKSDPDSGSLATDDPTFFPNLWISIDGLAWLAMAERQGAEMADHFPRCPPLARASKFGPFRSPGYPNLPFTIE